MLSTLAYFACGCLFGLAAGFTPGPMTALVVAQSVRFGWVEGTKVALAPLLTDAPIVALACVLVGQLAGIQPLLGGLTLLGASFLAYLAVEAFRVRPPEAGGATAAPRSWSKGVLVNLLNPHPYLFWLTIGAPTLLKAGTASTAAAVAFLAGFYACLVGAKVLIAGLAAGSRPFLGSRGYVYVNRLLGIALAAFALLFLRDGLGHLGCELALATR